MEFGVYGGLQYRLVFREFEGLGLEVWGVRDVTKATVGASERAQMNPNCTYTVRVRN